MNKPIIIFLYLLYTIHTSAQVHEDFSDNNLNNNPTWMGQVDSFIVNASSQLQLNATVAGTSYLSTSAQLMNGKTEWRVRVKHAFSGSNNNYTKFYVVSNNANLTDTTLQGYYLRFGENGNADALRFYKQNGNQHELLFSGKDSAIANSFSLQFKLIYSDSGYWHLYTAYTDENMYMPEYLYNDTSFFSMSYLGLVCVYTKSNSTKFYFDDIHCDEIYIDKTPPHIEGTYIHDSTNCIVLNFNEIMDSISTTNVEHYQLNPGQIKPDTVIALGENKKQYGLKFSNSFPRNQKLTLNINHLSDLNQNIMPDTSIDFFMYESSIFDVVINEIMAKPTPAIGLPDVEYIELKNRTPYKINLKNWKLTFGKTSRMLEEIDILPNGYLIVTAKSNTAIMSTYGTTTGLSSLSITDGGQLITLTDNQNKYIHSIDFSPVWHQENKNAGGWSLEMIDYDNPCTEAENWTSTIDKNGGTPGKKNSVYAINPDYTAPTITRIVNRDSMSICLFFSEKMLIEKLCNPHAYHIDRNITVDSILEISMDMKSVTLLLNKNLEQGIIYTLSINDSLIDCMGNIIALQSFIRFGYAQLPDSFDIIINEVLFDPKGSDGIDFVEIYNRSERIIDLKDVRLSNLKNNKIDSGTIISYEGFQLFPKNYALLSTNSSIIQTQYAYKNEKNFIQMKKIPTYSNDEGVVILLSGNKIIDRFDYTAKMHYPLLKSVDGVSLERINYHRKTQDASNWHSAASTVGYATPCYQNSSYSDTIENSTHFEVYPEIFSPDQDGYNDILNICYDLDEPGYRASITIYNLSGKKVKLLTNNILLDTKGCFTWDGVSDENIKAAIGIYIIVIEYYNLNGEVKSIKKTIVLASKH